MPGLIRFAQAGFPARSIGATIAANVALALIYFALAKFGLNLASVNPSATPVWPPTGLALASLLVGGQRLAPAIFIAAFAANATTAGTFATSAAIALGNTLEAMIGAFLIERWSNGRATFATPLGVAKFGLVCFVPATMTSATIGFVTLAVSGLAPWSAFSSVWPTWWLGDLTGAIVFAPFLVLWANEGLQSPVEAAPVERLAILVAAVVVAAITFGPWFDDGLSRNALGFITIVPLLWAALRASQRDTATVVVIISSIAVWGTYLGNGPFAHSSVDESFILLLMFIISVSLPVLVLSADVAQRRETERRLRQMHSELDRKVATGIAALAESRDLLMQAQKMDAIGQLTGGIAHDFNNLLMVIIGNLENAERLTLQPEELTARLPRMLDSALRGARRAAALTQRLLAFARRQPLMPKPLDVNKFLANEIEFLQRTLGETITIEPVLSPGLWRVELDEAQLEAAVLNLAVNARDAMATGGTLRIETANAVLDTAYCAQHPDLKPGQYVQIVVTDTGAGMTPDVLEHAFEPFFSTKAVGEGTGLGLSQVYGFVRQSGGHITIDSAPRRGTTVYLYFPRLLGVDTTGPSAATKPLPTAAQGETVLVVEDEELVRSFLVEGLHELGYDVLQAAESNAALAVIAPPDTRIDLMLTDVVLPGMNGRDLARRAAQLRPHLKILFMTGYSRDAVTSQGRVEPGIDMVQKPIAQADLAAKIRAMLDA